MTWLGLEGKSAVVTGGAAGIGKACCTALAAAGVNVAVADINEEGGRNTEKEIRERFSAKAHFVRVDITNAEAGCEAKFRGISA